MIVHNSLAGKIKKFKKKTRQTDEIGLMVRGACMKSTFLSAYYLYEDHEITFGIGAALPVSAPGGFLAKFMSCKTSLF